MAWEARQWAPAALIRGMQAIVPKRAKMAKKAPDPERNCQMEDILASTAETAAVRGP